MSWIPWLSHLEAQGSSESSPLFYALPVKADVAATENITVATWYSWRAPAIAERLTALWNLSNKFHSALKYNLERMPLMKQLWQANLLTWRMVYGLGGWIGDSGRLGCFQFSCLDRQQKPRHRLQKRLQGLLLAAPASWFHPWLARQATTPTPGNPAKMLLWKGSVERQCALPTILGIQSTFNLALF